MRYQIVLLSAAAFIAAPLSAAPPVETRIAVVGKGSVSRLPEIADLQMDVVGEGKSPEAATEAMIDVQARVESALKGFGLRPADIRTSDLNVQAVRGEDCEDETQSTGKCAVIGHRASQTLKSQLRRPELAGDAVAAAARAGATDTRISGMRLSNPGAVRKEASALAVSDANARAKATADAAGRRLGAMLTLRDSETFDSFAEEDLDSALPNELRIPTRNEISESIVVTGSKRVSVRPEPITTTVSVTATYALQP